MMAWLRLPRSLRTYIVLGLVITIAIITFSTSKILRIDASDPKPTFQYLLAKHNKYQSNLEGDGTTSGGTMSLSNSPYTSTSIGQSSLFPPISSHQRSNDGSLNDPNTDYHTTSVDAPGKISTSISATSMHNQHQNKPETNSDILIISSMPESSSSSEAPLHNTSFDQKQALSDNPLMTFDGMPHKQMALNEHNQGASFISSANQSVPSARSMRVFVTQQDIDQANFRKNFVRDMMKHAWRGYAEYAWGFNEVRPVSKTPHTESIFGGEKTGASIVDGIDTLYIMGLTEEYTAARNWIETNLDFNKYDVDLSVFETNIRYVGGLLSIYALTKDSMFLDKAVQIADKLLPAFETPSGIPYSNVNLRTGYARNHDWAYGAAILSEFGSMHLEFIYLSYVTGDQKYKNKALKIREAIKKAVPRSDGLYNNYMNSDTGQWLARPVHISMGALGDSFYEYLIKAYVQSDGRDIEAYQMYINAIRAYENKLIFTSTQSGLVYFSELKETSINHKMDSLACFSGGMLAMGAKHSSEPLRSQHLILARGIANTCHESCIKTKSHLGPETFVFSNRVDAMAYGPSEKYYILRPEILETYFYMWRYTHEPKYRDWAWDFVQALETYCKSEAGYSGVRNVYQPVIKDDVQQSFFLAEVLKYLYLIFDEDDKISLNDWVFNTEAHPLPILKRT